MSKSLKELELTGREVGLMVMLAALADPDPNKTDPEVLAAYYKAKSVVTINGGSFALNASLSIRRTTR